jgi:LacI family transcriptional regulator
MLKSDNRPTAIFAANDDMAAGVIRVAERLGIKVPEQLSVAGCDDIALAQQIYPALTTINQPLAAMADEAVMLLIDSARNKKSAQQVAIVPGTLKVRDSTGPAPKD